MRTDLLPVFGVLCAVASAATVAVPFEPAKPHNVKAEAITYKGKSGVRVTGTTAGGDGEQFLILPGAQFQNGAIDVEVTGEPEANAGAGARGFVGVAFRIAADASKYECFYLRPTNGRADDQVRRNHSIQYISFPEFPWQRLRKETPEMYESYVDLVPGEWTKMKIEVRGAKARLFVNGATQPALIVNDLKHGDSKGAIALWIGPGTVAHFANLRLTAE